MATIIIDGTRLIHKRLALSGNKINPLQPIEWKHIFLPTGYPLPNDYYQNDTMKTFELPDDTYRIINGLNTAIVFTLTAGIIEYDHSLDSVISGRGTNKLIIKGIPITIDARYLIGKGVMIDRDGFSAFMVGNFLPNVFGPYEFVMSSGIISDFGFDISLDGRVHFNTSKFGRYVSGDGTSTLKLFGYPVLIDGQEIPLFKDANPVFQMVDNHNSWSTTNVVLGNFMPLRKDITDGIYLLKLDAAGLPKFGFHLDSNGAVTVTPPFTQNMFNDVPRVIVR